MNGPADPDANDPARVQAAPPGVPAGSPGATAGAAAVAVRPTTRAACCPRTKLRPTTADPPAASSRRPVVPAGAETPSSTTVMTRLSAAVRFMFALPPDCVEPMIVVGPAGPGVAVTGVIVVTPPEA